MDGSAMTAIDRISLQSWASKVQKWTNVEIDWRLGLKRSAAETMEQGLGKKQIALKMPMQPNYSGKAIIYQPKPWRTSRPGITSGVKAKRKGILQLLSP